MIIIKILKNISFFFISSGCGLKNFKKVAILVVMSKNLKVSLYEKISSNRFYLFLLTFIYLFTFYYFFFFFFFFYSEKDVPHGE